MNVSKIYVGSDHAGFDAKQRLLRSKLFRNYQFHDLGTISNSSCDYVDYALKVATEVAKELESVGILLCGSGTGMCISANKVKGIRAAVGYSKKIAKLAVEHNDINVICFGARFLSSREILRITKAFLNASFQRGRHLNRVEKITLFEQKNISST